MIRYNHGEFLCVTQSNGDCQWYHKSSRSQLRKQYSEATLKEASQLGQQYSQPQPVRCLPGAAGECEWYRRLPSEPLGDALVESLTEYDPVFPKLNAYMKFVVASRSLRLWDSTGKDPRKRMLQRGRQLGAFYRKNRQWIKDNLGPTGSLAEAAIVLQQKTGTRLPPTKTEPEPVKPMPITPPLAPTKTEPEPVKPPPAPTKTEPEPVKPEPQPPLQLTPKAEPAVAVCAVDTAAQGRAQELLQLSIDALTLYRDTDAMMTQLCRSKPDIDIERLMKKLQWTNYENMITTRFKQLVDTCVTQLQKTGDIQLPCLDRVKQQYTVLARWDTALKGQLQQFCHDDVMQRRPLTIKAPSPAVATKVQQLLQLNDKADAIWTETNQLRITQCSGVPYGKVQQVLQKLKWKEYKHTVSAFKAKVSACVTQLQRTNDVSQLCAAAVSDAFKEVEKQSKTIQQQLKKQCKPVTPTRRPMLPADDEPEEVEKLYCGEREVTPDMMQWLQATNDGLTDKRLLCFFAAVPVNVKDRVGKYTVYKISGRVAGIAVPKSEKKQSWSVADLIAISIRGATTILNLILSIIATIVKMLLCGARFVAGYLFTWKALALALLLLLGVQQTIGIDKVAQYVASAGLQSVLLAMNAVKTFCAVRTNPATMGLYFLAVVSAQYRGIPMSDQMRIQARQVMASRFFKLFMPLSLLVCSVLNTLPGVGAYITQLVTKMGLAVGEQYSTLTQWFQSAEAQEPDTLGTSLADDAADAVTLSPTANEPATRLMNAATDKLLETMPSNLDTMIDQSMPPEVQKQAVELFNVANANIAAEQGDADAATMSLIALPPDTRAAVVSQMPKLEPQLPAFTRWGKLELRRLWWWPPRPTTPAPTTSVPTIENILEDVGQQVNLRQQLQQARGFSVSPDMVTYGLLVAAGLAAGGLLMTGVGAPAALTLTTMAATGYQQVSQVVDMQTAFTVGKEVSKGSVRPLLDQFGLGGLADVI